MRIRTIILLIVSVTLLASRGADAASDATPPVRQREFHFTYHSEVAGFPLTAQRIEAWIPLPREDRFQHVSGIGVETPAHYEIIDEHYDGNRLLHPDARAPMPPSIPVTIRFDVSAARRPRIWSARGAISRSRVAATSRNFSVPIG